MKIGLIISFLGLVLLVIAGYYGNLYDKAEINYQSIACHDYKGDTIKGAVCIHEERVADTSLERWMFKDNDFKVYFLFGFGLLVFGMIALILER